METGILENNGHASFFQGADVGSHHVPPLSHKFPKQEPEILDSELKLVPEMGFFASLGNLRKRHSLCATQITLKIHWMKGESVMVIQAMLMVWFTFLFLFLFGCMIGMYFPSVFNRFTWRLSVNEI